MHINLILISTFLNDTDKSQFEQIALIAATCSPARPTVGHSLLVLYKVHSDESFHSESEFKYPDEADKENVNEETLPSFWARDRGHSFFPKTRTMTM